HAPAAHAGYGGGRLLDLLRNQVAPALDHDVLAAPRDEQLTIELEAEVTAVEPAAGQGDRGRGLGLPVVAAHAGRSPERDASDASLVAGLARVVEQPDLVLGERGPHGHKRQ